MEGRELIGFVDGQTTNPSLIAKNPEIRQLLVSGRTLSPQEEKDEYTKIVRAISPLVAIRMISGRAGKWRWLFFLWGIANYVGINHAGDHLR
jgi:hypothetical protein